MALWFSFSIQFFSFEMLSRLSVDENWGSFYVTKNHKSFWQVWYVIRSARIKTDIDKFVLSTNWLIDLLYSSQFHRYQRLFWNISLFKNSILTFRFRLCIDAVDWYKEDNCVEKYWGWRHCHSLTFKTFKHNRPQSVSSKTSSGMKHFQDKFLT